MISENIELSFSAIETFNLCPRKYYYNYILKLPRKDWPWLVFGTFVHLSLEKFHNYVIFHKKRNREIDYSSLMIRAYKSASRVYGRKAKKDKSYQVTKEQKEKAKVILSEHLEKVIKNPPNVFFVEKGFRIKIGNFVIRGYIDRVDKIGENIYEVLDYKTSSKSYNVDKNYQLSLYAYALKRLLSRTDLEIVKKLDFIKLGSENKSKYKDSDDAAVEQYVVKSGTEIINSRRNLKKEEEWKAVDNSFCKFCDFKERCYEQRGILF